MVVGGTSSSIISSDLVTLSDESRRTLLQRAEEAREHAYAPYSEFYVGAAVLTESGRVFTGANVENRAYGATICAERSAITSAVSAGERHIVALAVAANASTVPPCGTCLQVLTEFAEPDAEVIFSQNGEFMAKALRALVPYSFPATNGEFGE